MQLALEAPLTVAARFATINIRSKDLVFAFVDSIQNTAQPQSIVLNLLHISIRPEPTLLDELSRQQWRWIRQLDDRRTLVSKMGVKLKNEIFPSGNGVDQVASMKDGAFDCQAMLILNRCEVKF